MSEMKSEMQERFCRELVAGCSKTQAAIKAGYSPRSAMQHGHVLAAKPHIAARVKELLDLATEEHVANVIERKIILSKIIDSEKSSPRIVIQAIRQMNKMEGVYRKAAEPKRDIRDVKIIYNLGSIRQERFCMEMITGCSYGEAAIRAGYARSSASNHGADLFKKPEIRARIEELQSKTTPRVKA